MESLLHKIRSCDKKFNDLYLDCIVLCKEKYYATINFSSKTVFSDTDKALIKKIARQNIPQSIGLEEINYSKIYCDEEISSGEFKKIIEKEFPSLKAAISEIKCVKEQETYNITADCDENAKIYAENNNVKNVTGQALSEKFKENFNIGLNYITVTTSSEEKAKTNVVISSHEPASQRFIKVQNKEDLIGKPSCDVAEYIADCEREKNGILLCGKIRNLSSRQTKNEKTLINFLLEDFTGKIPCILFPGEANAEKAKKLEEGFEILVQGDAINDTYRNCIVCKVKYVSFCNLPADFVFKEKVSKPEPEFYGIVTPKKIELAAQSDLFGAGSIKAADFLLGKSFTVFDIETTGLNYDTDRITEIGAVKIVNGIITESFSTLINPQTHIKDETVKLNGINDELVKNSPVINDVMPDFYKFTRNSFLVAQNIDFDLKFIKFNAKKTGYYFENVFYDTLLIAREKLAGKGLSNFKLNTLCDYFNIELKDHHRAWNDALATAELFIKLTEL